MKIDLETKWILFCDSTILEFGEKCNSMILRTVNSDKKNVIKRILNL